MEEEIKVSELPAATGLKNDDVLMIVQDDANKKINALSLNKYSTTETVIGTWINGEPLYRKVINFGALPDTDSKSVTHNILNLNKIVSLHGYSFSTSSYIPIPYAASNTSTSTVVLLATTTDVVIYTYQNQSAFAETYIVLEYTKTTN